MDRTASSLRPKIRQWIWLTCSMIILGRYIEVAQGFSQPTWRQGCLSTKNTPAFPASPIGFKKFIAFTGQSNVARVSSLNVVIKKNEEQLNSKAKNSFGEAWRFCASTVTGTFTAGALLLLCPTGKIHDHTLSSFDSNQIQHQVRFFQPRAAFAVEGSLAEVPHALDDSLPTPDAVGTMANPNDASALSPLKLRQRSTALDEVWSLVNKYYLDQTFNGQDWNAIRDKYEDQLDLDKNDDAALMKLTTEMVKSLGDKYSRVLDKGQYAAIQKFDLIGVGATLMPDADKRLMLGAPPVPGSAADQAGLKVGDFITAVNGVPTEGRTAFDLIDQISENPNAEKVTMTVLTQGPDDIKGEGKIREVTMARGFQEVKDPISYKISERRADGTVVGYIRMREFNSLVKPKLEAAIKALEKDGANAFVLDARSNPGGAFQSAVEIAGLFLDDTVATTVVDGNGVELPFKTSQGRVIVDKASPLAFWVDGRSASATEVLAGALRDNCRAVIMGEKSFGKGLIQAVYGLKNGGGLVLTVARYTTPGGTDIQGSGIPPDMNGAPTSLVPFVLSPDTSKVDFAAVKERLSPKLCQTPGP
eukprot:CAMPEP_0113560222 /NCGR_PEP_ID=MMETSP0015_2-20120614/19314_1 /TAXON_ID=2838 /ORGANISM="Odontella" /LENGTH=587 /DNA_ID=CAMNT_0000461909 /DNA_START=191 /DNA_END=1954 /DNA_ORIENTATION=- /assembly_acc=CAM_ASM_000160